jgi:hypothetical protein
MWTSRVCFHIAENLPLCIYRVLHNSLPFSFPKSFVWLRLVVADRDVSRPPNVNFNLPRTCKPISIAPSTCSAVSLEQHPWLATSTAAGYLGWISVGTQSMDAHRPISDSSIAMAALLLLVIRPSQFLSTSIDLQHLQTLFELRNHQVCISTLFCIPVPYFSCQNFVLRVLFANKIIKL